VGDNVKEVISGPEKSCEKIFATHKKIKIFTKILKDNFTLYFSKYKKQYTPFVYTKLKFYLIFLLHLLYIEKPFSKTHPPLFELMLDCNLIAFIPEPDRYLLTC